MGGLEEVRSGRSKGGVIRISKTHSTVVENEQLPAAGQPVPSDETEKIKKGSGVGGCMV